MKKNTSGDFMAVTGVGLGSMTEIDRVIFDMDFRGRLATSSKVTFLSLAPCDVISVSQ